MTRRQAIVTYCSIVGSLLLASVIIGTIGVHSDGGYTWSAAFWSAVGIIGLAMLAMVGLPVLCAVALYTAVKIVGALDD